MRPSGPNTTGPGSPSHIDLWLEDVTSAHTEEHEKSQLRGERDPYLETPA